MKHGAAPQVSNNCLSSTRNSYTSLLVASAKGSRKTPFAFYSTNQPTLSTMNRDIRTSNNATVEMAIVDFFHSENIPDIVVESSRFTRLVCVVSSLYY